jgi:hypothetical protein
MIICHIAAALAGFICSLQFARLLQISQTERWSYTKKSIRLSLCYASFAKPWNLRQGWKAGEAAFLSCAYDVASDWRNFDPNARKNFERILNDLSPPELRRLALSLYDRDLQGDLSADGLERGAVALQFILQTMGCEKERATTWGDLKTLGELLQIVDDVFDYEDDVAVGSQNCLTSPLKDHYLKRLLKDLSEERCRDLFGASRSILVLAIAYARKKGAKLLTGGASAVAKE